MKPRQRPGEPNPIRILIADDHPVLRKGLREVIEEDPGLCVIAETSDGDETLDRIEAVRPDVAVLDIMMPKRSGFEVLRELQARRVPTSVIFLTFHADQAMFDEAIALGAMGYLLKESALAVLVEGIKVVAAGQRYVTPSLTSLLLSRRERERDLVARQPGLADLTRTERRILGLIAAGRSSKEIADTLFVHYRTVENHRVNIAQKLGLRGHNAVLKFALENRAKL